MRRALRALSSIALLLGTTACGVGGPLVLTRALWAPPGTVTASIATETIECEVVETRGILDAASPAESRLAVRLVPSGRVAHARHVQTWKPAHPGALYFVPPAFDRYWLFAASSAFQPVDWDLAVFAGAGFAGNGACSARVTMWGEVDPVELGGPAGRVETRMPTLRRDLYGPEWETRALQALGEHDWGELLLGERDLPQRPLGWIGKNGFPLPPLDAMDRPADLDLAVELDKGRVVRIPALVLTGACEQELRRVGDKVAWRYERVWRARHGPIDDLPVLSLPLRDKAIAYEWSYPRARPIDGVGDVVKGLITPAVVVVDVAAAAFPPLQRFLCRLFGVEPPPAKRDTR